MKKRARWFPHGRANKFHISAFSRHLAKKITAVAEISPWPHSSYAAFAISV